MSIRRYRMTPLMRVFLWRLLYADVVSNKQMIAHLWGDDPNGGPETADKILQVYTCYIRKFLPIPLHTKWGYGHYISPDDMDKFHEYLVSELKEKLYYAQRRSPHPKGSRSYLQDAET